MRNGVELDSNFLSKISKSKILDGKCAHKSIKIVQLNFSIEINHL
jgi:hypothetical protein